MINRIIARIRLSQHANFFSVLLTSFLSLNFLLQQKVKEILEASLVAVQDAANYMKESENDFFTSIFIDYLSDKYQATIAVIITIIMVYAIIYAVAKITNYAVNALLEHSANQSLDYFDIMHISSDIRFDFAGSGVNINGHIFQRNSKGTLSVKMSPDADFEPLEWSQKDYALIHNARLNFWWSEFFRKQEFIFFGKLFSVKWSDSGIFFAFLFVGFLNYLVLK